MSTERPVIKENHLVLSALGQDRPGLVDELSRAILDSGGNIVDSRMTVLGGDFAIILLVSGQWNSIVKLENALPVLQQKLGMTFTARRTSEREKKADNVPYAVDVVALDHPGIVYNLAHFFSVRNINIEEMVTNRYAAAHTGAPMFSVHISVGIPSSMHIAALRDEFMSFCDELNLDAVIEPIKG